VIGLAIGLLAAPLLGRTFKGMTAAEAIAHSIDFLKKMVGILVSPFSRLIKLFNTKKNKILPKK
jgi:hypothetical protein